MVTQQQVLDKLKVDDKFAVNLLLALYDRQTQDEQESAMTAHENGVGFNGCDANILSSFAEQAIRTRAARKAGGQVYSTDLSPKQLVMLRTKLVKYARQLTSLTNAALEAKEEIHVTVGDNPYGDLPPTEVHPLPEHLTNKPNFGQCRETSQKPLCMRPTAAIGRDGGADCDLAATTGPLVACEGGFRFKTAKEHWADGGRDYFNDKVTNWQLSRDGDANPVPVGGGPSDDQDDPFNC